MPLENRPLSYPAAMRRIKVLWAEGSVTWRSHAQQRMRERGLDLLDVGNVIRFGRVTEHSHPGEHWRYKVEGAAVDGDPAACVVEIAGSLIVITVIA